MCRLASEVLQVISQMFGLYVLAEGLVAISVVPRAGYPSAFALPFLERMNATKPDYGLPYYVTGSSEGWGFQFVVISFS